jgi:predicted fused transcriptional regulator/phosphomethylpyrimidine kinase
MILSVTSYLLATIMDRGWFHSPHQSYMFLADVDDTVWIQVMGICWLRGKILDEIMDDGEMGKEPIMIVDSNVRDESTGRLRSVFDSICF